MRVFDQPLTARAVVLVEGVSDAAALGAVAGRMGRDLVADGVAVVAMGGITSVARFVEEWGPSGRDVRLAGLYDVAEERFVARALQRAGLGDSLDAAALGALGFGRCVADLEDELIRAHGSDAVIEVIADLGELRAWQTLQRQPAQHGRPVEAQLHRFMGTKSGRKERMAAALAASLEPDRVPAPLRLVLDAV